MLCYVLCMNFGCTTSKYVKRLHSKDDDKKNESIDKGSQITNCHVDILIWYGTVKNYPTTENNTGGIFTSCILNALNKNAKYNFSLSLDTKVAS